MCMFVICMLCTTEKRKQPAAVAYTKKSFKPLQHGTITTTTIININNHGNNKNNNKTINLMKKRTINDSNENVFNSTITDVIHSSSITTKTYNNFLTNKPIINETPTTTTRIKNTTAAPTTLTTNNKAKAIKFKATAAATTTTTTPSTRTYTQELPSYRPWF